MIPIDVLIQARRRVNVFTPRAGDRLHHDYIRSGGGSAVLLLTRAGVGKEESTDSNQLGPTNSNQLGPTESNRLRLHGAMSWTCEPGSKLLMRILHRDEIGSLFKGY